MSKVVTFQADVYRQMKELRSTICSVYEGDVARALALRNLDWVEEWLEMCRPRETAAPGLSEAAANAAAPGLSETVAKVPAPVFRLGA